MKVDVYIAHTRKGVKAKKAEYGYLIVAHTKDGKEHSVKEFGTDTDTQNGIILTAMQKALEHFHSPADITFHIHANSNHIVGVFDTGQIAVWKKNGFMKAKGGRVAHFTKWRALSELCGMHKITVVNQKGHKYEEQLLDEIQDTAF